MTQPLFFDPPLELAKHAAETSLPEDPNQWSDAVLQALYKQVSYLADFDLEVAMETVDGERGYGLGHVVVSSKTEAPMTAPPDQMKAAGIRQCRIPIIIKDNKLLPLDVLVTDDSRALPLTESRLRQAMFRPQNFDVTSKTPGDQSMIGQLYPPFRQNYGFGGGGVAVSAGMGGKTAAVRGSDLEEWLTQEATPTEQRATKQASVHFAPMSGSVLAGVLGTANVTDLDDFKAALLDETTKLAYVGNVATHDAIEKIAAAEPSSTTKLASAMAHFMKPTVVQVVRQGDGMYAVKTASHFAWDLREEQVDRGELVRRHGVKVALAADTQGAVTMAPEAPMEPPAEEPIPGAGAGPISAPGMYQVQTTDGETLTGVVIPNLLDTDGSALPISLFTNGQQAAVQADISGVPVGEFTSPGTLPASEATGHGVFYSEAGGIPVATLPLTLGARVAAMPGSEEPGKMQAQTFDGRPVEVSVQPYVATVVGVEGQMLIPANWCWLPLEESGDVALAETPGEVGKVASAAHRAAQVDIRAGGLDSFTLRGYPVEKLAADDRNFLNQDQALFVLVGCGVHPTTALAKMAQACSRPGRDATVQAQHVLKQASEVRGESYLRAEQFLDSMPVMRHRMWKEAAVIPDPVAVDTVLSLGFLNPENISAFIGYLPTLDEAQRRMCELLIGARLGLRELSDGALERAIRALEDTIEALKVVAFQG